MIQVTLVAFDGMDLLDVGGPYEVLLTAGLLDGRPWTTHHEDVAGLAELIGASGAVRECRWVDSGNIITGAGLSSGIAAALHLVERLHGRDLATRTARQIEYVWDPDGGVTET